MNHLNKKFKIIGQLYDSTEDNYLHWFPMEMVVLFKKLLVTSSDDSSKRRILWSLLKNDNIDWVHLLINDIKPEYLDVNFIIKNNAVKCFEYYCESGFIEVNGGFLMSIFIWKKVDLLKYILKRGYIPTDQEISFAHTLSIDCYDLIKSYGFTEKPSIPVSMEVYYQAGMEKNILKSKKKSKKKAKKSKKKEDSLYQYDDDLD
jgi:hypothetical protein